MQQNYPRSGREHPSGCCEGTPCGEGPGFQNQRTPSMLGCMSRAARQKLQHFLSWRGAPLRMRVQIDLGETNGRGDAAAAGVAGRKYSPLTRCSLLPPPRHQPRFQNNLQRQPAQGGVRCSAIIDPQFLPPCPKSLKLKFGSVSEGHTLCAGQTWTIFSKLSRHSPSPSSHSSPS